MSLEKIQITEADQPKPDVNQEFPRLYGHLLCPFVEKVRLALAARGVTYQHCEVDLGKKTSWHLALNGGLVPIWETPDGTILTESKVLMDYVEDAYPTQGYSLLPSDPVLRAQMRLAIPIMEAVGAAWFPIVMKRRYEEPDFVKLREKF